VKKNKIHIALSVFLLALILVGRVGIHIFHHHETTSGTGQISFTKAPSENLVFTSTESDVDCALCKLDAFQEISLSTFAGFIFLLFFAKPFYHFFLSDLTTFSFFTKNRGPPSFISIA
jgi:hypothetical protein